MDSLASLLDAAGGWFRRRALFFKIIGVGFFGLLLLIPLSMVDATLRERKQRSQEAIGSITQTWGRAQRLIGPVLVVPYVYKVETEEVVLVDGRRVKDKVVREHSAEAFFLPEELEIHGTLEPSERRRGIYTAHVYSGALQVSGRFAPPDFAFINSAVREVQPRWDRARVGLGVSDLRGTREALSLQWGNTSVLLQPGARLEGITTGLHAPVPLAADGGAVKFALTFTLNGSESFSLVPVGRKTQAIIESSWRDPSFGGAFLPVQRKVDENGFSATWQVSYYGRDFPQQWTDRAGEPKPGAGDLAAAAFGVTLFPAVDAYRTVERSIKYGVLFVTLVFTTFFLFEAVCGLRLNALNYLLVGAALCLFFLGLLALSEFWAFGAAYGFAAAAATALIGLYAWRVLRSGRRALIVSGMLGGVYGYLFFVLRMEDFSLLAGTAALFAVLAAVMYATRNLRAEVPPAVAEEAAQT